MFNDIELSRDLSTRARADGVLSSDVSIQPTQAGIDVDVRVLTVGHWPTMKGAADFALPAGIEAAREAFESFYLRLHSGRRLAWVLGQGTVTLRARFDAGPKELVVSPLQCSVLTVGFESADRATLPTLAAATGADPAALVPALLSLCDPKTPILLRDPPNAPVKASSDGSDVTFVFNSGLRHRLHRLRPPQLTARDRETESVATDAEVDVDRGHRLDAAVVRVMKGRKTLGHALLHAEVSGRVSGLGSALIFRPSAVSVRLSHPPRGSNPSIRPPFHPSALSIPSELSSSPSTTNSFGDASRD